ncbi:TPA: PLP-dependent aminotransferase family protein [Serratia odorifera]|nr:PLP-dependent aminotransferase family protein [Serratia odorifera]
MKQTEHGALGTASESELITAKIKPLLTRLRRQRMTLKAALHLAIKQLITAGELKTLSRLPPSRRLASALSISRDTVEVTYAQLEAEGYLARTVGRGSFVSYRNSPLIGRELLAADATVQVCLAEQELSASGRALLVTGYTPHTGRVGALTPSAPDLRQFPIDSWLQLEKSAVRHHTEQLLGYGDPQGLVALRSEIVDYLRRERGVKATAEQVVIVSSSQQALSLCTQVLFNAGDAVFVEEPGYQGAKKLVRAAGLRTIPIEVDQRGINVDRLVATRPSGRGVYVTPSHHYPLGHSLDIERRLRLLAWARQENAWIIEDDYDAEFTYHGMPTASLQGLDQHQRTLYIGTFSKTLFPGLRLGFIIVPPSLIIPMVAAKQLQDGCTATLSQATLYAFLRADGYTEHLRNMRRLYKARLEILFTAVNQYLAEWTQPHLPQGGLQLVCPLADAATERRLVAAGAAQGIRLYGLADFYTDTPGKGALVLGFAAYTPNEIVQFIKRLAQIFAVLPATENR